jgi:hypothetical protein
MGVRAMSAKHSAFYSRGSGKTPKDLEKICKKIYIFGFAATILVVFAIGYTQRPNGDSVALAFGSHPTLRLP